MKDIIFKILLKSLYFLPIQRNKVLFVDYYGSKYGCNPKYISKALADYKSADIVWAFINPEFHKGYSDGRSVKWGSLKFFYELATSKVFVTNFRMPLWYKKRKGQFYIQTWHTPMNIKAIEKDTENTLTPHYVEMAKADSKNTSLLISTASFATDIFKRAFWYDGEIFEVGAPRCDILINQPPELKKQVKIKLGLPEDKKILLYAPTFRKGHTLDIYNIDFSQLIKGKESDWIILVRLHPHLQKYSKKLYGNLYNVRDVTDYDDLQEILLITDFLISDYSGLIFDYSLTMKPCILYVPDLENYCGKDRKLYFNIEQLPFPICKNLQDLTHSFQCFDERSYKVNNERFLESIGMIRNGGASEIIASKIIKTISKS